MILKVAGVAGGYIAAFLVAAAAVAIRVASTSGPDAQAASGMYASTIFSPHRFPRVALLAATVVEAAVSVYGGFVWFVPLFFHGR